ncbi:MAG: SulP family inorganic anion transporter, partial [Actinomycetota bacterium]|nr:SulP family inorganic anion transporter [Actinomycetota bacterium]
TAVVVPTVGDQGDLPSALPTVGLPDVPYTLATLQLIAPYVFGVALVGLMESLMTAKLVDDIADTHSDKTRESWGQGVANIVTGLFGGMGGCAMIGQTMINVKASGARTRLSTFYAGVLLLILVVALGPVVSVIPMAALVAVMVIVAASTSDWHSVQPATLKAMPRSETAVMVSTVAVVVVTHNLAYGVIVGVLVACDLFARRVAHLIEVTSVLDPDGGTRIYTADGPVCFVSSNDLVYQFDYAGDPDNVVFDMSNSHIWDASSVAAMDAVTTKYARRGKSVEIVGLNEASAHMHKRLAGQLGQPH